MATTATSPTFHPAASTALDTTPMSELDSRRTQNEVKAYFKQSPNFKHSPNFSLFYIEPIGLAICLFRVFVLYARIHTIKINMKLHPTIVF